MGTMGMVNSRRGFTLSPEGRETRLSLRHCLRRQFSIRPAGVYACSVQGAEIRRIPENVSFELTS